MTTVRLTVNGVQREIDVAPGTLLVHAIREQVGLTGTHVGCLTGDCGACTVVVDGATTKSCSVLAHSADGATVETVESLADGEELHPVQRAFWDEFGFQCGFCLPGMLLTAKELIESTPDPDDADIHRAINGNLCRCTGYNTIVAAVRRAAKEAS
ncbi:4-hydroxybenzoyl-CoA reductase subunit gamma [Actinophytocola xinjiangensis]|uniref:4-hydroxybenzoyl-CoA reductase subunit gamma n=1 Tax=Actinophytocola xinjiangensis TaxID=485602 RepID=A0A7Z0WSI1_9PSEU|nr:(2Fe-2S)-binding protein [Actinophytocola xinjiangensis]OLF14098.1 4-hydroxybenzoyl-CoA reductase subunit gamma [Actinophytocola xinjiangensis]